MLGWMLPFRPNKTWSHNMTCTWAEAHHCLHGSSCILIKIPRSFWVPDVSLQIWADPRCKVVPSRSLALSVPCASALSLAPQRAVGKLRLRIGHEAGHWSNSQTATSGFLQTEGSCSWKDPKKPFVLVQVPRDMKFGSDWPLICGRWSKSRSPRPGTSFASNLVAGGRHHCRFPEGTARPFAHKQT